MAMTLGSPSAPADEAEAVTPSDTVNFTLPTRGLYIGSVGNVSVVMNRSGNVVTFIAVQTGTLLPIVVSRVNATLTTATSIIAVR